ncbi:DUF1868-domain-containing protein [Lindgomyces ingoldianus]|uniref:DUF1868-domain-containing protein n=1 Tax=Lindgomyces ingoldianus TaxID=673940 RepID=A0ACB6RG04_9PLEO|nr:DUF1868-domain-containing protein [Lindgomyces ingoldianus]KAF2478248.1 DUF1868-domain-containing protein [Lindgomyces ingoldianus]
MESSSNQMEHQQNANVPQPRYPLGIPSKFDIDGKVQPFPGNTIISHLSPSSDLYASLLSLYEKLRQSPLSSLFALLPPSSWHMTVFEGVCDQIRKPGFWPSDLAADAHLEECDATFTEKLALFDLQCNPPYRMSITGFEPLEVGIGLHVEPSTSDEAARLRQLRDRLADLLQIRHPGHDSYSLHLSMAYLVRHLTERQKSELLALLNGHFQNFPVEFELGPPEFCRFEDMFAFQRQFYLKDQEKKDI